MEYLGPTLHNWKVWRTKNHTIAILKRPKVKLSLLNIMMKLPVCLPMWEGKKDRSFLKGFSIYSHKCMHACVRVVVIKTLQHNHVVVFCLWPFPLQIKLSSVQLAKKYMKRVASELDALSGPEKEPTREFLILQGVRFAFRVHQVIF